MRWPKLLQVVLPIFAVLNWLLSVALVVGYTRSLGFVSIQRPRHIRLITDPMAAMPQ